MRFLRNFTTNRCCHLIGRIHLVSLVACALFVGGCSNRKVFVSDDGRWRMVINLDVITDEFKQRFRATPKTQEDCWRMVSRADMMATCLCEDDSCKLQDLIDHGCPIDNYFDHMGSSDCINTTARKRFPSRTLLLEALRCGAVKCARLLLDCKVDVGKVDSDGYNALMLSAYLPEDMTVEMIDRIFKLSAFDVNAKNCFNETALSIAIERNNGKYIDWLLRHGADYNATTSRWIEPQCTLPIWFNAVNARQDIFEKFMNLPGVDFQVKDSNGVGVLWRLRVRLDDYDARFKRLVEKGAGLSKKEADAIVHKSMRKLGDCKTRVAMICSYMDKREVLNLSLSYARMKRYLGCVEVLKNSGRRMAQAESK